MKQLIYIALLVSGICHAQFGAISGESNKSFIYINENKAFYTAEGFGKYATGGEGGIVVKVTNLNPTGPGSFKAACEQSGSRIIIFDVEGVINSNGTDILIDETEGDLTIAGQTAPGEGVTFYGGEFEINGASNVIVRYMRFRSGDAENGTGTDAVRIITQTQDERVENIIFDHCSVSWGDDEVIGMGGSETFNSVVQNVTIQNSIISEAFRAAKGVLTFRNTYNVTFYRNYLAHNKERNIRSSTATSSFEQVNNIIYGAPTNVGPTYENYFDIVSNVFKQNPAYPKVNQTVRLESSSNNSPGADIDKTRAHILDNLEIGGTFNVSSSITPYLQSTPVLRSGLSILPSAKVEASVLNSVGASIFRDAIDTKVINDYLNTTGGIITTEAETVAVSTQTGSEQYPDTIITGIDDAFSTKHGIIDGNGVKLFWYDINGKTLINSAGNTNLKIFLQYKANDFK